MKRTATLATLAFYASHPGWHTFDRRDKRTREALSRLHKLGFLELNTSTYQACFTGKVFE